MSFATSTGKTINSSPFFLNRRDKFNTFTFIKSTDVVISMRFITKCWRKKILMKQVHSTTELSMTWQHYWPISWNMGESAKNVSDKKSSFTKINYLQTTGSQWKPRRRFQTHWTEQFPRAEYHKWWIVHDKIGNWSKNRVLWLFQSRSEAISCRSWRHTKTHTHSTVLW